jgi:heme/copper-type cytochrome/quinol oxidase subunit 2
MQVDSLISSIMFPGFLSMAVVMGLVIGVIVVVLRMIARNNNPAGAASRMRQPVSGTLLVTGISMPTESAI